MLSAVDPNEGVGQVGEHLLNNKWCQAFVVLQHAVHMDSILLRECGEKRHCHYFKRPVVGNTPVYLDAASG